MTGRRMAALLIGAQAWTVPLWAEDIAYEIVRTHSYPLQLDAGQLTGPGAEYLMRAAEEAHCVVLGEPHNTDDVPAFTNALFKMLHDAFGFDALVLEQGSDIMAQLGEAALSPDRDEFMNTARQYAESLHFKTEDELRMIESVFKTTGNVNAVWGVDRALAADLPLERIASANAGEISAAAAEVLRVVREHNASEVSAKRFMLTRSDDVVAFGERWRSQEGEPGRLAELLYVSAVNLQTFRTGDEAATRRATADREGFMKAQLVEQLERARAAHGSLPRFILKLGHTHCDILGMQGDAEPLGAFVNDLANAEGRKVFFVNVQVINSPGKYWSLTDYPDYDVLTKSAPLDEWRIIDLSGLRNASVRSQIDLNEAMSHLVRAYDAVLLLGGASRGSEKWLRSR